MTLAEYCRQLGWSNAELARQAGIDEHTVGKAMKGVVIASGTARQIAAALSRAMGKTIMPGEIEGLTFR